jgi:hypothetical protein
VYSERSQRASSRRITHTGRHGLFAALFSNHKFCLDPRLNNGSGLHMRSDPTTTLCPSAQPAMANSFVFGVVNGTADKPRLRHLTEPQPVTPELLEMAAPVRPTEVFRFAAPCAGSACCHFDGTKCQLAGRIVKLLPPVIASLPPCQLRPNCRWWQQEGKAACLRCPQVVTESEPRNELFIEAAGAI